MSENKTGKYFKYAIGEIILVVIGILIALQINNWNEDRLEGLKEIDILVELKENLLEDINENKATIGEQSNYITEIKNLVIHLESKLPYSDTLSYYLRIPGFLERFEINTSAYETLKGLGIELLSSKELKNKITRYYDVYTKHKSVIVDRLNTEQRGGIESFKWKIMETYEGPPEMLNYHIATKGRFYINYLQRRISWKTNFINDICARNVVLAEELVAGIDKEVKVLGIK